MKCQAARVLFHPTHFTWDGRVAPPPLLRSNAVSEDKTRVSGEKDPGMEFTASLSRISCQSRVPLSSWTKGWS